MRHHHSGARWALTHGRWWRIFVITTTPGLIIGVAKLVLMKLGEVLPSGPATTSVGDLGQCHRQFRFLYLTIPCALSLIYLWIRNNQATDVNPTNVAETG